MTAGGRHQANAFSTKEVATVRASTPKIALAMSQRGHRTPKRRMYDSEAAIKGMKKNWATPEAT
jgi:hypothetical protein